MAPSTRTTENRSGTFAPPADRKPVIISCADSALPVVGMAKPAF
jgi:hypothetical protein